MNGPVIVAFCTPDSREHVIEATLDARLAGYAFADQGMSWRHHCPGDPILLLAIGPEGGAALAAWIERYRLDGVAGVGLVGVTAPWAARIHTQQGASADCFETPIGPLEPLRAVAERARFSFGKDEPHHPDPSIDAEVKADQRAGRATDANAGIREGWHRAWSPMRLAIACAPDDGVCVGCGDGHGARPIAMVGSESLTVRHIRPEEVLRHVHHEPIRCEVCVGTGKALSSRDVAAELVGSLPGPWTTNPATFGGTDGVQGLLYPTRAALDEHGLRAVVARLAR